MTVSKQTEDWLPIFPLENVMTTSTRSASCHLLSLMPGLSTFFFFLISSSGNKINKQCLCVSLALTPQGMEFTVRFKIHIFVKRAALTPSPFWSLFWALSPKLITFPWVTAEPFLSSQSNQPILCVCKSWKSVREQNGTGDEARKPPLYHSALPPSFTINCLRTRSAVPYAVSRSSLATVNMQAQQVLSKVADWQSGKNSSAKYAVRLLDSSFHYYICLFFNMLVFEVERERERDNQVSLFNWFCLSQIYSSGNQLIVGQGHKGFSEFLPDTTLRHNQLHHCIRLSITLPAFGFSLYNATELGSLAGDPWFSWLMFLLSSWFSSLEWLEVKQTIPVYPLFLFFLSLSFKM